MAVDDDCQYSENKPGTNISTYTVHGEYVTCSARFGPNRYEYCKCHRFVFYYVDIGCDTSCHIYYKDLY